MITSPEEKKGPSVSVQGSDGKLLQKTSTDRGSCHRDSLAAPVSFLRGLKKSCMDDESRPGVGVCLIAFSLPLLVPGITLTVVAFDDETGFTKYSTLHVLGMLLLALAICLFTAGVLMHLKFRSRVAPELQISTQEKSPKELEAASVSSLEGKNNARTVTPVNFIVDTGTRSVDSGHLTHFSNLKVGSSSAMDTLSPTVAFKSSVETKTPIEKEYISSTDDGTDDTSSFDSEEVSSGSYIVEDFGDNGANYRMSDSHRSHSSDKVFQFPESAFTSDSNIDKQELQTSSKNPPTEKTVRFFSFSQNANNYFEERSASYENAAFSEGNEPQESVVTEKKEHSYEEVHDNPAFALDGQFFVPPSAGTSPGSRQRLQAHRSDTSSQMDSDEQLNASACNDDVASFSVDDLPGRCDSNASVFLKDEASQSQELVNTTDDPRRLAVGARSTASSVRWSLPVVKDSNFQLQKHGVSHSTGTLDRTASLGEEHSARERTSESLYKSDPVGKPSPITLPADTGLTTNSSNMARSKFKRRRQFHKMEQNSVAEELNQELVQRPDGTNRKLLKESEANNSNKLEVGTSSDNFKTSSEQHDSTKSLSVNDAHMDKDPTLGTGTTASFRHTASSLEPAEIQFSNEYEPKDLSYCVVEPKVFDSKYSTSATETGFR